MKISLLEFAFRAVLQGKNKNRETRWPKSDNGTQLQCEAARLQRRCPADKSALRPAYALTIHHSTARLPTASSALPAQPTSACAMLKVRPSCSSRIRSYERCPL